MKKLLLFFTNPIVGGALSLIGLLEILFSIPSSYFTYQISLWIIVLVVGVLILLHYFWKRIKILYYIKTYTSYLQPVITQYFASNKSEIWS